MKKISEDILNLDLNDKPDAADPNILRNLLQRRKVYGDVTQNVSNEELETLLRYHENIVPKVIAALEIIIEDRDYCTFIPPAFYDRDGSFVQPPSFQMQVEQTKNPW